MRMLGLYFTLVGMLYYIVHVGSGTLDPPGPLVYGTRPACLAQLVERPSHTRIVTSSSLVTGKTLFCCLSYVSINTTYFND